MKFFSTQPIYRNEGLALIRIITGLFMAYHGWEVFDREKMLTYMTWDQFRTPASSLLVYTGKSVELVAGVLLALGLLTRVAALMLALTMLYISFFVGGGKIWYEDQHPFLFVLLALVFLFTGPSRYSLDQLFFTTKDHEHAHPKL
ncbi:MAG TPA: DoxX family membrane protein [Flavisolibacter sp.]|jgi:uncharacterized membrane protein YphA (DoxX/SURF4 family)|nr:DoxX family membrane protein [Flavisolibacter sp.]